MEDNQREMAYPESFDDFPGSALIETLTRLCRQKGFIATVTGLALLAGAASYLLPARYTAATSIMPPHQTQSATTLLMSQLAGAGAGTLAAAASGGLGFRNPDDIYIALLKSRPVADAMINQFGLEKEYHARDMTEARQKLAKYTSIVSDRSELIVISVSDRNKRQAAAMANAYTDQLRALTQTLAVTEASQRRLFYEEQLKLAKDELVRGELALEQVQQKKGLVQLDAQTKAMIEGLADLRAEIAAKEVQVQALRSYSTDQNPELQLAERELDSLRGEAAHMEQHSASPDSANLGLRDVPGASLEYLEAAHEVAYRQTLFDLLIKQYDAARLDEAHDAAVIQVVESAIPPDRPSSPHHFLIMVLSMFLGFAGAITYVLVADSVQANAELARKLQELRIALLHRAVTEVPNQNLSAPVAH